VIIFAAPSVRAEVEWNLLSTLNLDRKPLDIATSADGKTIYILTSGEILIYSPFTRSVTERIPVDQGVDQISVMPRGGQLLLGNGRKKTFSILRVDFIHPIDTAGNPFKGPADAPVVIAVFEDFQ